MKDIIIIQMDASNSEISHPHIYMVSWTLFKPMVFCVLSKYANYSFVDIMRCTLQHSCLLSIIYVELTYINVSLGNKQY